MRYIARHDPQSAAISIARFGPQGSDDKLLEILVPETALADIDQIDAFTDDFGYTVMPTTML